nr:T9SS type A sorting domain-containing protein [uncultured Carboxylicivirga sp.]
MMKVLLFVGVIMACLVHIDAQSLKSTKTFEGDKVVYLSDSVYYLLDSVYSYTSVNNKLAVSARTYNSYDSKGNILESRSQKLENGIWANTTLIFYTYTDNNSGYTQNHLQWNDETKSWNNIWKKSFIEDQENNKLNIIYSEWIDSSWEYIWQQDQYYNQNWQLLSYQTVKWNPEQNKWESYWDYNCYYDNNGNLLQTTHKSFNTETQVWSDEWECIQNYESGNLISEQIIDWDPELNNWTNIRYTDVNYSTGKVIKTRNSWNEDKSDWSNSMLITEVTDELNYITEIEKELWDENSTSWKPQSKDVFTYDNNSIKSSETTLYWNSNTSDWQNNFKKEYFYSQTLLPGEENIISKDYELVLYPNPAKDDMYLKFSGDAEQLNIFKMDGTLVMQVPVPQNGQYINVSSLKNGAYIAKISFKDGVAQTKFVKK